MPADVNPVDFRLHLNIDISAWDEWRVSLVAKAIEEAVAKLDGGYTGLEAISIESMDVDYIGWSGEWGESETPPLRCWCGDEATHATAGSDASPRQPMCAEHTGESGALDLRQFGDRPQDHPTVRDWLGLV